MAKQVTKVSIVVPLFNVEDYIMACLNSIKSQTYDNFQVVLVNDGSTDQTEEVVKAFIATDSRYELLTITNHGPGFARNRGLERVTGSHVVFVDSDDYLATDALALLVQAAEQQQADLVIGQTLRFDEKSQWPVASHKKYQLAQTGKKEISSNSELFYAIGPAAKLFAKELVMKQGFSESKRFAEDQLLVFNAYIQAKTIYMIEETVYYYQVRSGDNKSLTQTYRQDALVNLNTMLTVMAEANELIEKVEPLSNNLTQILVGYYNRICEIELRVLFKANLRMKSHAQKEFYQVFVNYLEHSPVSYFLLRSPHFWQFIVAEQLTLFFLVKRKSYDSYFDMLTYLEQYSNLIPANLEEALKTQLDSKNQPIKQLALKAVKLINYGLNKVLRRNV